VQFTAPNSQASITFGKCVTTAMLGSYQDLMLIVADINAARNDLISRGVAVSYVYHYDTRPFHSAGTEVSAATVDGACAGAPPRRRTLTRPRRLPAHDDAR